jgi:hypothetical protein
MQRTSFKWGQAAKLAAGAALVFAVRELGRGDRSHYVAVSPSFFCFLPHPLSFFRHKRLPGWFAYLSYIRPALFPSPRGPTAGLSLALDGECLVIPISALSQFHPSTISPKRVRERNGARQGHASILRDTREK